MLQEVYNMSRKIIEFEDGLLVEVEVPSNRVAQISRNTTHTQVNNAIDTIRPVLLKACRPIVSVSNELNQEISINNADVELQLGFSLEVYVFLAKKQWQC